MAALGFLASLFLLHALQTRADAIAPTLQVANLKDTSLVLIYSELLLETSTPATSDYSLSGTTATVSSVTVRGAEVALTLSTAPASSDTVTLTYTKGTSPVKDKAGNDASPQSAWPVKNHTGASNSPPAFSAETVTLTVDENSATGANVGSPVAATDSDSGDTLDFLFLSGYSEFTVDSDGQIQVGSVTLDFEGGTTTYETVLFVRDNKSPSGGGESVFDDSIHVTINVTNVDEAGTVTLPPSIRGGQAAMATLTDPDMSLSGITWQWSRGETASGSFDNISGATSQSYTPMTADLGKYLKATANYTDVLGSGKTATSAARGPVASGNSDPTFNEGSSTTRTVPENSSSGTHVGAALTAMDNDNDALQWSLTGTDASSFQVIGNTGIIIVAPMVTLDYETKSTYSVDVHVRDNKDAAGLPDTVIDDSITVTITLTNEDDPGTVTLPTEFTSWVAATATVTDPDVTDPGGAVSNLTWQWSIGNTPTGSFTNISGATSATYTPQAADVGKYLKATARYTDPHGPNKMTTSAASSQVVRGNVDPTFDEGASTTRSVAENSPNAAHVGAAVSATDGDGDMLQWSLTGTDASSFQIIGNTGIIIVAPGVTLNHENKDTYSVDVHVRDNLDADVNTDSAIDDTIEVTINIINVDEMGTVTIAGTEIGGETLTATLTDPDEDLSSVTWRWARGNSASGPFTNISGATSNSYALKSADVGKYVRAMASYTDGHGAGKSANAVTGEIDPGNAEPEFPASETGTRSLAENSGGGVNVGAPVAASDDDGDTLTYSLAGTDAGSFNIVSSTGQIRAKNNVTYNYEGDDEYEVTVNVRDSKDNAGNSNSLNDDSITVTITLTDVNETPAITTTQTSISVQENQTSVLTYAATDVDNNGETEDANNTLTWSVENADDGSFFEIDSSSGVLTFKNAPNFEDRQDAGGNNIYNVTVTVTDNGIHGARGMSNHLSISKPLAVTVTDVNEAPTLTSAPTAPSFDENGTGVVATYIATDPDATTGTMTWDLMGNDAGDFNITSTTNGTAELTFKNAPDYEMPDDTGTDNVYDVTVRVRDNGSPRLEDTQTAAITVNDLNETPVITGNAGPSFAEIEFDHTATASELVIGTYAASDDDNSDNVGLQTITFDVSGTDAAHFSIDSSTGVLSFDISPDFENPVDMADSSMMGASDNKYEIVVEADDGQGGTGIEESVGRFSVTVTVTNVNETPEIPAGVNDESFAEIEFDAETADLDVMTYIPRDEETSTADLTLAITWSLAGTDAADFQILRDTTTGHGTLSFRNRPNFEDPSDRVNTGENHAADDNMYQVIVKISDGPNTRDYPLTITVTNVNETPIFTAESSAWHAFEIEYDSGMTAMDMSIIPADTPNQAYWYEFLVRDEEGQNITWTITGDDAAYFVIDEDSAFTPTANADERAIVRWAIVPNFENPLGSSIIGPEGYVFTVEASDGTNIRMHEVFIRIDDVNEQPSFTDPIALTISLDEHDANETWAGTSAATYTAYDEEGGVRWSLTGTDAGDFNIDIGGNVTFKETPNFEDPRDSGGDNVYNFNVVVTDIQSKMNRRTAMQPVTVTVQDVEEEGTASIEEGDESPGVDDVVTFIIDDPDGVGTAFDRYDPVWVVQRSSGGSWSQAATASTAVETYDYTVQEADSGKRLRVQVTYTDRRGDSKTATSAPTDVVTADPRPNVPPRITKTAYLVEEGPAIIDIGIIEASDRDNDPITFAMLEQDDYELFELSSSGRLRAVQALDFEAGASLGITITLSDGKGLDSSNNVINDDSVDVTETISIILADVEEEGVITFSPQEPEAGASQTATLADSDGNITGATWQWSRSMNRNSGFVNISGATSGSYTPTVNDEGFYLRATVSYTDRRGGGKRAEAITGPVPSENRRPLFPSTETGQRTVPENTRAGVNIGAPVAAEDQERDRLTYSLTGADAAAFTINSSTGQIRVKDALDFETKSRYQVTVEVHDGKDGTGATSTTIDDTQSVTITVENVEEPGTVTLSSETATIQARVSVTATLEDDDGPTSVTWQWARSTNRANWANIAGATSATFTPADTDAGNYVRATASYNDGEGQNKSAVKVSPRVGQPPPVNSAPAFPATEDGRREVAENSSGGTIVGAPVVANDFNNDSLTYSLTGTDAALFTIGANDGQLRVATGAQLDFETKRTLRVTVEVTDGANSLGDPDSDAIDDRQNVTITLTDVNEEPAVTGDAAPSYQENSNRAVATYTGTDPERDTLTWSVSGSTFWISQRGQLHFATPPSYEDGTNYSVTITAEDEDGLSGSLFVSVTVTDVEEAGVVTMEPKRGWDGTSFQAQLDDDDSVVGSVDWQWQRSSNRSNWSDISGATSSSYTAVADDIDQYLRATAAYEDDRGSGKEASVALAGRIGDSANQPATNNAPQFSDATAERSVGQGAAAGRNIGAPVQATDADSDDILTYSLGGSDVGLFEIDPATGQLKTWAVLDYDSEGANTYEVQVSAHDNFNASYSPSTSVDATITVTINVTQVAQRSIGGGGGGGGGGGSSQSSGPPPPPPPPPLAFREGTETSRIVPEDAQPGDKVGSPVLATSVLGLRIAYSLNGTDSALFTVDEETGQIHVADGAAFDYEGKRKRYGVTLQARTTRDNSSTETSIEISIFVSNVDLPGIAGDFDLDHDECISLPEVLQSVNAYFGGDINLKEVLGIVTLYFEAGECGVEMQSGSEGGIS